MYGLRRSRRILSHQFDRNNLAASVVHMIGKPRWIEDTKSSGSGMAAATGVDLSRAVATAASATILSKACRVHLRE